MTTRSRRNGFVAGATLALIGVVQPALAQDPEPGADSQTEAKTETPAEPAPQESWSLDLGFQQKGFSFGNSRVWNGVRINARDQDAERIRGLNLTLFPPGSNPQLRLSGFALGLVSPQAARLEGLSLGLISTIAGQRMDGFHFGGLAAYSEGSAHGGIGGGLATVVDDELVGIGVGGLATVAGDLRGVGLGGLATVTQSTVGVVGGGLAAVADGPMRGVQVGGIALVGSDSLTGLSVGGLAVVSGGTVHGIQGALFGIVAQDTLAGLTLGGLAAVAGDDALGAQVAGLAIVAEDDLRWLNLAGLAVHAGGTVEGLSATFGFCGAPPDLFARFGEEEGDDRVCERVRGLAVSGLGTRAHELQGLMLSGLYTVSTESSGCTVAAVNYSRGHHSGLSLGLFNRASDLYGVQIGLLNYVAENPPWMRLLPLFNFRFP